MHLLMHSNYEGYQSFLLCDEGLDLCSGIDLEFSRTVEILR